MQKAEKQHQQTRTQPVEQQGKRGMAATSPQSGQIAQFETLAESSPRALEQAQLASMVEASPRVAAQRRVADMIHNSPRQAAQRKVVENIHNGPHLSVQRQTPESELVDEASKEGASESLQTDVAQREEAPAKPNNTGLPDNLKSGIESLSGMSMDNVRVHYNSSQPAQFNAHAYAQGTDIHIAPGQEQHLPHEAWHVVQQAQGRVQPTMQMKQGVPVNDDKSLEHEADVMGAKATSVEVAQGKSIESDPIDSAPSPIQRKKLKSDLKGIGSGYAGQWHQGDEDFHVTVYDDDPNHILKRGFKFVSNRFVSEFHVSDYGQSPVVRQFYNIDTGQRIGNNPLAGEKFDQLAKAFMDTVVASANHYTDDEALQDQLSHEQELKDQENIKQSEFEIKLMNSIESALSKTTYQTFEELESAPGMMLFKIHGKIKTAVGQTMAPSFNQLGNEGLNNLISEYIAKKALEKQQLEQQVTREQLEKEELERKEKQDHEESAKTIKSQSTGSLKNRGAQLVGATVKHPLTWIVVGLLASYLIFG